MKFRVRALVCYPWAGIEDEEHVEVVDAETEAEAEAIGQEMLNDLVYGTLDTSVTAEKLFEGEDDDRG